RDVVRTAAHDVPRLKPPRWRSRGRADPMTRRPPSSDTGPRLSLPKKRSHLSGHERAQGVGQRKMLATARAAPGLGKTSAPERLGRWYGSETAPTRAVSGVCR